MAVDLAVFVMICTLKPKVMAQKLTLTEEEQIMKLKARKTKIFFLFILFLCYTVSLPSEPEQKIPEIQLPLEVTRTIEFTTDEGTWMTIDVSPNGNRIIFDLLGDLYLIPINGGEAQRITSGPAWDSQPRFSPDGEHILFVSDRSGSDNLWLIHVNTGELRALTKEKAFLLGSPVFSPNGSYIVARKGRNILRLNEIWLYHKEGGKGIQLTKSEGPTTGVAGPTFSPDGKYIYFSSSPQGVRLHEDLGHWQVSRLNRDTGKIETITSLYGGGLRPIVSPNGRYLVYGSRYDAKTGMRLRDLESGAEQWLVYPIDRDEQEGWACSDILPGYDFTPDSRAIVLSYGGKIHKIDIADQHDTLIPFKALVQQQLATRKLFSRRIEEGPIQVRQVRWPNQSPDGNKLVFSALGKIWIMDLPSGKPQRLTHNPEREYAPNFSPDGKWITYVSWSDKEGGYLWKVATDGGKPLKLSRTPAFCHNPCWSPDGKIIAFVRGSAQAWLSQDSSDVQKICWIPADGGEYHEIVASPLPGPGRIPPVQQPTFSEDGQRIYYLDYERPDSVLLRSTRLDGTDRKIHLIFPEASQAIASPDGEWAAFTVRGNAYLAAIPRTSEAITIDLDSPPVALKQVTNEGGEDLYWENGGKILTWGYANHFFRIEREVVLKAHKIEDLSPAEFTIDLQVPRHVPQGKIALQNAQIISMRDDDVIQRGDIVVENNRILAVGPTGKVKIPDDATIINLQGKTIIPGLIDLHNHFHPIREIFLEKPWSMAALLAYGVTTGFDPFVNSKAVFGHSEMVETGNLLGQRIFSTGTALNVQAAKIESFEDAQHIVRRYKKDGAIFIKEYIQPRRIQRQWLIMAAHQEGLNVTSDGGGDLAFQMTHVLDGYNGFSHSIPAAQIYKDVIQLLARSKTFYDVTLSVDLYGPLGQYYFRQYTDLHEDAKLRRFTPHEEIERKTRRRFLILDDDYRFKMTAQGVAEVVRNGGYAVIGGHGEQQGLSCHWELWMLAMGGLSPLEVLRVGTLYGAECLGLQADLGSLEPGKIADLIVLNSNPLKNIRNSTDILYVMKNGELFEAETLNQIWPEKKPFGKFYWQLQDEELKRRTQ